MSLISPNVVFAMQPFEYDHLTQLIYAGTCKDESFYEALRLLAVYHGCSSSAFMYADRTAPGTDVQFVYGPFGRPEVRSRYLDYASDDPAPRAMARLGIGEAAATDRLFSREVQAQSRFINEFYRPLGLEEALGGPVASGEGRVGIVAIHRGPDRGPFEDEEIATFARLLPHFAQAINLRRTFFASEARSRTLTAALETASSGVMVFDRQGILVHANARARSILGRADGLALTRSGRLRAKDPEAEARLRSAANLPNGLRTTIILRAQRDHSLRPYILRLMSAAEPSVGHEDGCVIYVSDPDSPASDPAGTLEAALGLSRQAAALVAGLLAGGDLNDFATSAGVSRNTAKFHLQAAFAATGTARQVDLVTLAAGVVRDLGEPHNSLR